MSLTARRAAEFGRSRVSSPLAVGWAALEKDAAAAAMRAASSARGQMRAEVRSRCLSTRPPPAPRAERTAASSGASSTGWRMRRKRRATQSSTIPNTGCANTWYEQIMLTITWG